MKYETKLQIQAALAKRGWTHAAQVINEFVEALESTDEQKALRNAPARDVTFNHEIHTNPRADAWAAYFAAVYPDCNVPQDVMLGWFANAMMAMHDYLNGGGPINGDHAQFLQDQAIDEARGSMIVR